MAKQQEKIESILFSYDGPATTLTIEESEGDYSLYERTPEGIEVMAFDLLDEKYARRLVSWLNRIYGNG